MPPLKLLIVDDDETMRLVCRRFFERTPLARGIEVDEAESGERAIAMLREKAYDCVISDYRMGAVSGLEVLTETLKLRPKALRVMMSGFGNPELVAKATLHAKVHEFIEKPMSTSEMNALLQAVVLDRYLALMPA